jgi:hypothetical protein
MRGGMLRLSAGPVALGIFCASCSSNSSSACPASCNPDEPAVIELCGADPVVGVSLSGVCSLVDAGEADATPVNGRWAFVTSSAPGDCDVTVTYAGGTTASVTVTFAPETPPEPAGCPACPPFIAPSQSVSSVGTCIFAPRADAASD